MDNDDLTAMRIVRRWILGLMFGIVVIGGIATITDRAFDLAWFPWDIQMKTEMIRASNSYITTQQEALRQFRMGYETAATDGQKAATIGQMCQISDTIPQNVPPDIARFLASRCQ